MRHALLALAVVVTACSPPATAPIAPTTTIERITTTTRGPLEVELQSCRTPPLPFSSLCETYNLIQTWYVDGAQPDEALVAAAIAGLNRFETEETADPPRKLLCAVPTAAFESLCEELARRIDDSQIPYGPAMDAAMTALAAEGLGPFSYYVPPDEVGSFRPNGVVGGIGALVDARDAVGSRCARVAATCRAQVVFVLEDNPGAEAGLLPGDLILEIDGEPTDGLPFVDIVSRLAGNESGTVTLTVDREGLELEIVVERRPIEVPTVELEVLPTGVGYLRIPDFEVDIPEMVSNAVSALDSAGVGTVVVDLRDNPGGLVDAAVAVISEFVPSGTVMRSENIADVVEHNATGGARVTGERLIVLVNQGTASAAEITTAALRDRRNAIIVGTPTFGKNAIQVPFDLLNGGRLFLVVARWTSPNGDSVVDLGLIPDREVAFPPDADLEELVNMAVEATR